MEPLRIVVEAASKRAFASALDWPGWSRAGRGEADAMEALLTYAPRYAVVVARAGLAWPGSAGASWEPVVVERHPGTATTEFGAPDVIAEAEQAPPDGTEARRLADLLSASWAVFDDVVAASPAELRKGPRGGGRDRDKMHAHVLGAEASYARLLGLAPKQPEIHDVAAIEAMRADILEVVRSGVPRPVERRRLWPVRYAVRRFAWHVLDHAWEMEDRRG